MLPQNDRDGLAGASQDADGCAVYYGVAASPSGFDYMDMVLRSLESLRQVSPAVKVYCVLFGSCSTAEQRERLVALGAVVQQQAPLRDEQRYFVKWHALRDIPEQRVLFLDADTYLFEPVEPLFQAHTERSFYSRAEYGCNRSGPNYDPRECNWPLFDKLAEAIGLPTRQEIPIYNTGVMILNHGFHRDMVDNLQVLDELRALFVSGELPYPHRYNRHIIGEITATFLLGSFEDRSFGDLVPGAVTFWPEHHLATNRSWGTVCHTFASYYSAFLQRLPQALADRRALSPAG